MSENALLKPLPAVPGETLDDCERFILGVIDDLTKRHREELEPWVKRLVALRALRPMPMTIMGQPAHLAPAGRSTG